jgi:hypothetical protein
MFCSWQYGLTIKIVCWKLCSKREDWGLTPSIFLLVNYRSWELLVQFLVKIISEVENFCYYSKHSLEIGEMDLSLYWVLFVMRKSFISRKIVIKGYIFNLYHFYFYKKTKIFITSKNNYYFFNFIFMKLLFV